MKSPGDFHVSVKSGKIIVRQRKKGSISLICEKTTPHCATQTNSYNEELSQ